MPPCPQDINLKSQTEYIPGKNCKLKPTELSSTTTTTESAPEKVEESDEMKMDDFMLHLTSDVEVEDYPPKEKWRASATLDQIRLVDSAREKGLLQTSTEFIKCCQSMRSLED